MASRKELVTIAKTRLKTAKILYDNKDWDVAVYIMGYVLEAALKAATCKTLDVDLYPDSKLYKNDKIGNYFMTHNFDMLLLVSGLSAMFSLQGSQDVLQNWSDFTREYQGDWTSMRYTTGHADAQKAKKLYDALYDNEDSIIRTISRHRKW